ncbi:S1 family peptidase [Nocardia sp. NPDC050712]|uniref:S1 family peptidase n=1 Tax=Nocardia sp. NPDC050712 TaxID=3155518 RepID=UPI0033CD63E5
MNERARHRSLGVAGVAAAITFAAVGTAQAADPPMVGGGSGIIVDSQAQCTLTTVGYDRGGRLLGLTAGHCGQAGAKVVTEANPNYGVVGRFVYSNPELDYALIEFTLGKINPVARVGETTITGIGAPAQFPAVVCKKGRTTGTSCGVVWGNLRAAHHETWTQLCVLEGDSGAPVMSGSTLVGMVNAYLAVGCLGPEVGTNMSAISADLEARDDVGAGFHPIQ